MYWHAGQTGHQILSRSSRSLQLRVIRMSGHDLKSLAGPHVGTASYSEAGAERASSAIAASVSEDAVQPS
eukprot:3364962-Pyramimonas_sp.AAC.1